MRRPSRSQPCLLAIPVLLLTILPLAANPALAQRNDTVVLGLAQEPETLIRAFSNMLASGVVLTPLSIDMVERDDQG